MAQAQASQAQVQELVYEKLKENLQEWDIEVSGSEITASYESPYYEENADLVIWFNGNSIEIEYITPTEEPIDPECFSSYVYDTCMQEKDNEDICQNESEKAYKQEEKRITDYDLVIERIHNEPIEHYVYIPAKKAVVNLTLPADMPVDKAADLIVDIAMSLIHNI